MQLGNPLATIGSFMLFLLLAYGMCWLCFWAYSRLSARSFLAGFLIAHLALLICLAIVELCGLLLGLDFRDILATHSDEPWRQPLNQLDLELLHIHKPNQIIEGIQPTGDIAAYMQVDEPNSYPFRVQIDSLGFRNSAPYTGTDIALIGDSFIEAATVSEAALVNTILAQETGQRVVNLGQLWYGSQQEFAVLRRFALPLKPKAVVWFFFSGNDLSDYARYERVRDEWGGTIPNFHGISKTNFTRNALIALFRAAGGGPKKPRAFSAMCPDTGPAVARFYFHYIQHKLQAQEQERMQAIIALLGEARREVEAVGSKFFVAYAPNKQEVYYPLCKSMPSETTLPEPSDEMFEQLRAGLEQQGAALIDLRPALRSAAQNGEPTYFKDDTHWTAAGHAVVARLIRDKLKN